MYYNRLKTSEFFRNFITLMGGTGTAALISIVVAPLLTRLYSPEDFGIFAVFISIASIITSIGCLRYEIAIMLPRYHYKAVQLVALCLVLCCGVSFFTLLVVIFWAENIADIFNKADLVHYLYLLPLIIFVSGATSVMTYFSNRHKRYKALSISKVANSLSSAISKYSFGYAQLGPIGLILGQIIGICLGSITIWSLSWVKLRASLPRLSAKGLFKTFLKYKNYLYFSMPAALVGALSSNLHIILFAKFYGEGNVGYIALATQILMTPLAIIGTSFSQIFYQKISLLENSLNILNLYKKSLLILMPVSGFIILVSFLIPDFLLTWVFGSEWQNLGNYFMPLSLFFAAQFLGSTVSTIYIKLDRLGFLFIFSVINTTVTVGSIFIAYYYNFTFLNALIVFSLAKAIIYVGLALYGISAIQNTRNKF